MTDALWMPGEDGTVVEVLRARVEDDPDGEYLDVCGTKLTAADVFRDATRVANSLAELGVRRGDRVAILMENSPEALLAWFGIVCLGAVAVPINTAYKGAYLRHQLSDSGSRVLAVQAELVARVAEIERDLPDLTHVVVVEARDGNTDRSALRSSWVQWTELVAGDDKEIAVDIAPGDLAGFIYTGGTTGPSKGCMLSHGYHLALTRQIGTCWRRTGDDVAWAPLPMYHFNVFTTVIIPCLLYGGRGAIHRRFSVSNFWAEINRTGATIATLLGTMAYLLAHDTDRPEMPRSGQAEANTTLRLFAAAPMPTEVDTRIRERFGTDTFSGAFGLTEASLVSWQPLGVDNKPNAAGVINDDYFDVRIFDDDDNEAPRGTSGEIVIRPKRSHVMFEGYWGRPEATMGASRNWWFHTGDVGIIDDDDYLFFVDRKADYLRRRGENISSFEVERILMGHGDLADVAVHAVPSDLTEDDLKVTATVKDGGSVTEEELFRWCIDKLPYFALPRYVEFRAELPRSPVGRVLKRDLRDEGVTDATWDADTSGIEYEKR